MRRTKEEAMQTRDDVLNAAAEIIATQGVNAFTIDAVARTAGVTKGGVLHHFPSKEALVNGLVDRVIEDFTERLTEELEAEPGGQNGRWLRAYLRTIFAADFHNKNLIPSLSAVVAADQTILNRLRDSYIQSQAAAEGDGIDPAEATVIRLAIDGIAFSRSLNLEVLTPAMGDRVYEILSSLAATGFSLDGEQENSSTPLPQASPELTP